MAALNSIVSNGVATGATYLKFNSGNTNINMDKMVSGNTTIEPKERVLGSNVPRFTSCTDNELVAVLQGYYNNTIPIEDIKATWHVGDTRTVHLSAMEALQGEHDTIESHREQDVDIVLIGFNHDELAQPINGHTTALITVQLKDVLLDQAHAGHNTPEYYDGSTNTENGYICETNTDYKLFNETLRNTWLEFSFISALPQTLQACVKSVNKKMLGVDGSELLQWDHSCPAFLLSLTEIYGGQGIPFITPIGGYTAYANEGEQYEHFVTPLNPEEGGGRNSAQNQCKYPLWYDPSIYLEPQHSIPWWTRSMNICYRSYGGTSYEYYVDNWYTAGMLDSTVEIHAGDFHCGISPAWCM